MFIAPGHDELAESLGYAVLADGYADHFDGEGFYALRDGRRYGLLSIGVGCCEECDSLRGCESPAEVDEVRESWRGGIAWRDSAAGLLELAAAEGASREGALDEMIGDLILALVDAAVDAAVPV